MQGKLGLTEDCCTFDLSQACPSFLHTLSVAHSMLCSRVSNRALIINADALTSLINPLDRSLVALHGDAGVAAIIERSDANTGVDFFKFGTDGSQFHRIAVPAGGARKPSDSQTAQVFTDLAGCQRNLDQLYMDGPAIFHFAIHKILEQ